MGKKKSDDDIEVIYDSVSLADSNGLLKSLNDATGNLYLSIAGQ